MGMGIAEIGTHGDGNKYCGTPAGMENILRHFCWNVAVLGFYGLPFYINK